MVFQNIMTISKVIESGFTQNGSEFVKVELDHKVKSVIGIYSTLCVTMYGDNNMKAKVGDTVRFEMNLAGKTYAHLETIVKTGK